MTDPTPDPLDELASAHLDGEATGEEEARASADPEVARRVAAFEGVRAAVRTEVPVAADRREAAIAAALAAFGAGDDEAEGPVGSPTPISAARRDRVRWARAVGVAAAVALVAAVVPLLLDGDDGDDVTAARQEDSGPETAEDRTAGLDVDDGTTLLETAPPGAGGAAGSAPDAAASTLSAAVPDLGAHPDLASLRVAVAARAFALEAAPPTDPAVVPSPAGQACLARTSEQVGASGRTIAYTATAVLAGRPVVVVVGVDDEGARTLVVAEPDGGCATVADVAL